MDNKKYISLNNLSIFYSTFRNWINSTFCEKQHIHEISDINNLQRKIDELTPPPDIETSEDVIIKINQLSLTINDLTNNINNLNEDINNLNNTIETLTPSIGEIYITVSNENHSEKFKGTIWEKIKDTFLLASGDVYMFGSTGGEATHTLTIEEMPSHTHTYKRHAFNNYDTDPETGENIYGVNNKTLDAHEGTTGSSGGGEAHNNMPPYLAVNVYKRIA